MTRAVTDDRKLSIQLRAALAVVRQQAQRVGLDLLLSQMRFGVNLVGVRALFDENGLVRIEVRPYGSPWFLVTSSGDVLLSATQGNDTARADDTIFVGDVLGLFAHPRGTASTTYEIQRVVEALRLMVT